MGFLVNIQNILWILWVGWILFIHPDWLRCVQILFPFWCRQIILKETCFLRDKTPEISPDGMGDEGLQRSLSVFDFQRFLFVFYFCVFAGSNMRISLISKTRFMFLYSTTLLSFGLGGFVKKRWLFGRNKNDWTFLKTSSTILHPTSSYNSSFQHPL